MLSHNAFSKTQNNGKTLESFFDGWESSRLAQVFLQPEEPDWSFCENYFLISDYDMLNRVLTRRTPGKVLLRPDAQIGVASPTPDFHPVVKHLYQSRRNGRRSSIGRIIHRAFVDRRPVFVTARELIWSRADWDRTGLRAWIADFKPDVILFQGSSCAFAYKLATWMCDTFALPIILQLTDDYTYRGNLLSPFDAINNKLYLRQFSRMTRRASSVIVVSEAMASEYAQRFGGRYRVLMNSVEEPEHDTPSESPSTGVRLLYAGNLGLRRWNTLLKLGEALHEVNARSALNARLDIFAPSSTPAEALTALSRVPEINYRGFVTTQALLEEVRESTHLVHVESFDKSMRKIARLSVSTKIPEYLASGRPILAIGPGDVESIQYLRRNKAAYVISDPGVANLTQALLRILTDGGGRDDELVHNALALHRKNHTRARARHIIDSAASSALSETRDS